MTLLQHSQPTQRRVFSFCRVVVEKSLPHISPRTLVKKKEKLQRAQVRLALLVVWLFSPLSRCRLFRREKGKRAALKGKWRDDNRAHTLSETKLFFKSLFITTIIAIIWNGSAQRTRNETTQSAQSRVVGLQPLMTNRAGVGIITRPVDCLKLSPSRKLVRFLVCASRQQQAAKWQVVHSIRSWGSLRSHPLDLKLMTLFLHQELTICREDSCTQIRVPMISWILLSHGCVR